MTDEQRTIRALAVEIGLLNALLERMANLLAIREAEVARQDEIIVDLLVRNDRSEHRF